MRIDNVTGIDSGLTGSFSGSFVGQLDGIFTGTATANISGAFANTSHSLSERIAAQELFSGSLNDTFATDAELSSVSGALAFSIANISSDFADITNKPTLISSSAQIATDISGSFTSVSQSLSGRITGNETSISALSSNVSTLNSATSSYLLNTTDTLTGDLTVTGKITAQEFHTEFVSASIIYDSGSTKFGNSADDRHEFTGSIASTGNLTIGDSHFIGNQTTFDNLLLQSSTAENIVLSSANDIYISTQGTSPSSVGNTRLFISSSGNIGIGTITPTSKLHVVGTSLLNGATTVSGGALTTTSTISAGGSITAAATGFIELKADQTDSAAIRLGVSSASTEAFVIADNSGTGHITGDTSFKVMGYASSTLTEYARFTSTSTQIKQGNLIVDGSAGIGTTSPASKIHIHTTDAAARPLRLGSSGNSYVALDMYTDTIAQQNLYLIAYGSANAQDGSFAIKNNASHTTTNGTAGDIWFATGASSTERMRIKGNGDIGIGTTSPTNAKVHIVGDASYVGDFGYNTLTLEDSSGYPGINWREGGENWLFRKRGNNSKFQFLYSSDATAQGVGTYEEVMCFEGSTGYVGIGTDSPTNRLHIAEANCMPRIESTTSGNSARLALENPNREWRIGNAGSNNHFWIYDATASSYRFDIDTNGNVGIGTTSPKDILDIKGGGTTTGGGIAFGTKSMSISATFANALTVSLGNHTGVYVKITAFGDWSSHSTIAYVGEFFLQNGAGGYMEPGIIIREDTNIYELSQDNDNVVAQIVDPGGSTGDRDFIIQLAATRTSGTLTGVPFTAHIQYEVRGQYKSIS